MPKPISLSRVNRLLEYDEQGFFCWRVTRNHLAKAGAFAGTLRTDGYWQIWIDGNVYLVHQLVWFIHTGIFVQELDHKDRNRSNNRIGNLRECTRLQNVTNTAASHVYERIDTDRVRKEPFMVRFVRNGKKVHQSFHATREEAVRVAEQQRTIWSGFDTQPMETL